MTFSILTLGGWMMFLRWIHYMSGVMWIGLLYYFNFVQGSFMNETDAPTKSQVTQKLVPRALFWFRWGAMGTFISGLLIIMSVVHGAGTAVMHSAWWVAIATGASLGTLMWFNVWFVIWPNQKIIIKNAVTVAGGGAPDPRVADCAIRGTMASRTNTVFSIPMLFFMGAASHLGINVAPEANLWITVAIVGVILALFEFNALKGKKLGPMTKTGGFVHIGIGLAVLLYLVLEFTTK